MNTDTGLVAWADNLAELFGVWLQCSSYTIPANMDTKLYNRIYSGMCMYNNNLTNVTGVNMTSLLLQFLQTYLVVRIIIQFYVSIQ